MYRSFSDAVALYTWLAVLDTVAKLNARVSEVK